MKAEIGRLTGDVCDVVDCAWITGNPSIIRQGKADHPEVGQTSQCKSVSPYLSEKTQILYLRKL
jgi:hypothetical protein